MAPARRSVVWKYFVKLSNETVKCKLCEKEFRFNSSTTNMRAHLRCRSHAFVNLDDEEYEGDGATTSYSGGASANLLNKRRGKDALNYQKLVLPVKMRSIYWKCFGFPASESGDILSKTKVICLLCKHDVAYNGNTGSLKMHLQSKHAREFAELENSSSQKEYTRLKEKKKGMKMKGVNNIVASNDDSVTHIDVDLSNQDDYEEDVQIKNSEINPIGSPHINMTANKSNVEMIVPSVEQQSCTIESLHPFMIPIDNKSVGDAVTEFIIMDMQLPDIVEGRGFQRLIATLKSPCEIPSRSKLIEEIIPREYDNLKELVQETMQNIKTHISLSVEEWESSSGNSYITFSVSYHQEKDEYLSNKVLSTVNCQSSYESFFWENVFDNLLEEWNLKLENMKVAVCATTRQELLDTLAGKGLTVVPCLVHTLQEVCVGVCLNQVDVREILAKCRILVYLIYKSSNALAALRIQDHLMVLEETPLVSDNVKVWLSTYNMLEGVLARRQVIPTILDNIDPSTFDKDLVNFTDQDWTLIEDVIAVLEPFKVTLMTLSEERSPLVSLLKPLLWQLVSIHLKPKDEDSVNVQIFKSALKNLLSDKYSDPKLNQLLDIATTLDPRFKSLANMVEESKSCLDGPIKDSLTKLIEQSPKDVKPIIGNVTEKKKPRLLGMVMMLGDMCPAMPSTTSMSNVDRTNLELVQYQSEEAAPLDQCPMAWWSHMATKCPHLSRLVTQYTCIPAVAIPLGRNVLESHVSYVTKRANLIPEVIDRIIFLNANNSL